MKTCRARAVAGTVAIRGPFPLDGRQVGIIADDATDAKALDADQGHRRRRHGAAGHRRPRGRLGKKNDGATVQRDLQHPLHRVRRRHRGRRPDALEIAVLLGETFRHLRPSPPSATGRLVKRHVDAKAPGIVLADAGKALKSLLKLMPEHRVWDRA